MKFERYLLTSICLLLAFNTAFGQEPKWVTSLKQMKWMEKVAKIELLKTDKVAAERILGKPDVYDFDTAAFIESYTFQEGRVFLQFTTERCDSKMGLFDKGVVETMTFSPSAKIDFARLKLPWRKFKKSVTHDAPSLHIYSNEKDGVTVYVQSNSVSSISFRSSDFRQLCPQIPAK
jgi:hypothetical protein